MKTRNARKSFRYFRLLAKKPMKKTKFTRYVYDKKTMKTIVSGFATSDEAHEAIKKLEVEKPEWRYKLSCEAVDF